MWIDFEGVDGSGKTSVSNRVAELLRRRGVPVVHAREGGAFASPIAGRVRDLARSTDSLGLAPETELLLNLAREAQIVAETVRPALARGAWVITDRTTYSHLGLARYVRGLAGDEIDAAARVATGGLRPDRVFLIDVDPDVARWRRRVRKIRERRLNDAGRKGLAGDALVARTRRAFHDLAVEGRWTVVDNTWRSLEEAVEAVMDALDGRAPKPGPSKAFDVDPADPVGGLLAFAATLQDRSLAALLAAGLDDPRAEELWRAAPADVAACAVAGMDAPRAWALREDLKEDAPFFVARGLAGPRAWSLRRELEDVVPDQVLHSLAGEGSDEAHALRARRFDDAPAEAVRSTREVDDPRAWELRGRAAKDAALAESVAGLDDPRAWRIREELQAAHPLAVVKSLRGLDRPEAWAPRRALAASAPKIVLASIDGLGGPEAWALREALRIPAPEETAASMAGLDTPEAWRWRAELRDAAPVGVIKSLRGTEGPKADALIVEILTRNPGRLRAAREAAQFRMNPTCMTTSI
ncbi:MAG TPA: dTMP kinase [Planctomycetota bacterium]